MLNKFIKKCKWVVWKFSENIFRDIYQNVVNEVKDRIRPFFKVQRATSLINIIKEFWILLVGASEAATRGVLLKKGFLNISQISQEKPCVGDSNTNLRNR